MLIGSVFLSDLGFTEAIGLIFDSSYIVQHTKPNDHYISDTTYYIPVGQ